MSRILPAKRPSAQITNDWRLSLSSSPGAALFWISLVLALPGCGVNRANLVSAAETQDSPQAGQADSAAVARSQKPENEQPRRAKNGSILDLVAYEVAAPNDSEVKARIRATVNSEPILDEEVREAIYPYLMATQNLPEPERSARRKEAFEKELQQLIEREVALQDMFAKLKDRNTVLDKLKEAAGKEFDKKLRELRRRSNVKSDEEFKAMLKAQGLSLAGVRRQVERNFMAMEYMRNRILPAIDRISHQQIMEYYNHHPEEFQVSDGVTWQDIFIDAGKFADRSAARQFAEQLVTKARAAEDFQQLVMQYDNGDSSYRKGEGYGHRKGEIKPLEAEPILFQMRDGEIGPVIELTNGYHVIKLVKREYAGLKPFDEKTQAAVRNKLQSETWDREYKRIMNDLKRHASIEISTTAR
jgi:parvulin-like peptidyl-prolyl isomerase